MRLDVVIMRIVEVMKMNKSDNFTVLKVVVDNVSIFYVSPVFFLRMFFRHIQNCFADISLYFRRR